MIACKFLSQRVSSTFWHLGLLLVVAGCQTSKPAGPPHTTAGPRGHAHNDYEHPRPLFDALSHGFTSVEADIHLVDGALLVAHDADEVDPGRTLQKLYLDPLQDHLTRIGKPESPFILLIDIKTQAEPTYRALETVLAEYTPILTTYHQSAMAHGPLMVLISGNRPFEYLKSQTHRLAALDGRLSDLDNPDLLASEYPLISDNWKNHFSWRGQGPIPAVEQQRLADWVQQTHSGGHLIRFWGNPDVPAYWQLAQDHGVDLINTDRLEALAEFLQSSHGSVSGSTSSHD